MNADNKVGMNMTSEIWNTLAGLMDVLQLENFIENLDYMDKILVSDAMISNFMEDFGGGDQIVLTLNSIRRMNKIFKGLHASLEGKKLED